ncbi:MAG TPA: zinc ABC transporter substrate-binding protein [Thermoleophilaceae bacterium]|jgi:iron/zinc/copper transport system substrate-binding protein/iron/zinc/copper transport system permease protein
MDWLTDPWSSELMRRAFAEALLVGAACGALGCFVVVRGLAFLGEAIAHVLILGAVVALLLGGPVGVGAFAAAALAVWLASVVSADRRFAPDTAIGILLPSFFGLAVVLIALSDARRSRLEDLLFGSILSVEGLDLALAATVAALAAALVAVAGKELALAAFDRRMAGAMGYRLRVLDLLLFAAVALAAIVALRAVGNVLVAALLLGPPLIARHLARSFAGMVAAAAAVGAAAGVAGLYWSWHMDVGAGAAIVLVIAALYALVAAASLVLRRAAARPVAAAAAATALLLAGCGGGGGGDGSGELRVVATTMQLADMSRQVGGDLVEVDGILGPDAEPHEYEPRPSDAEAVADADVVISNGGGLDGWLGDLLDSAGGDAKRVEATAGIERTGGDPHVWHDPENAKRMVGRIEAALIDARPASAARFRANAQSYRDRIDRMARSIRALFAPIPAERRKLVTSHDSFGYFARAYGVEVVGSVLPGLTTDAEPSGEAIRRLVDDIRRAKVDTIFTEAAVNAKLERQVAGEAGARVATDLYADTLGADGSGAETLVDAELHNARAMAEAWR